MYQYLYLEYISEVSYPALNSLPDDVVSACSVSSFKRRLDLIWRG